MSTSSSPVPAAPPVDGSPDLEALVTRLSARLLATPPEGIESLAVAVLEDVRVFFGADRCGLLSVGPDSRAVRVRYASYREGVKRVSADIDLADLFPWSHRMLLDEKVPVCIGRLDDLPPEAAVDRAVYAGASVRSTLTVPILVGQRVEHLISVQTFRDEVAWPAADVARLRLLAEMLVSALERARSYLALAESERRASLATDSADAGLWALDLATNALWMSDRARTIFEFPIHEELSLSSVESVIDPDDIGHLRAAIAAATEARLTRVDYRIRLSGGRVRWISAAGRRESSPSGHPGRLTGVCVDITDRKEREEAFRINEGRLAAGARLAGLGFYEAGDRLQITWADDTAARICGTSPGATDTLLQVWLEHLHEDDRARVLDQYNALNDGRLDEVVLEYRYMHPQLGQRWLHHQSRVTARDGAGRPLHKVGVIRDVSEQREAERALRVALGEVERLRDRLQTENLYLRQESHRRLGTSLVVGRSAAIRRTLGLVEQVAPTNATVLITGETGTGKERIATLIHEASPRKSRAMVRVNCSAIPTALIEAELFGREKGAYTGAVSRQSGRFEVADGSTLFLDEVADLPLDTQVKLLRVLQEHTIERLGNPRPIKVDVRIIAATNRAIEQALREGTFRSDLYYRLNVFPIEVPPLRYRLEDLELLVMTLVDEIGGAMGKRFEAVAKSSISALQGYDWPGNVRELRNVIERAMILSPGPTLEIDLPSLTLDRVGVGVPAGEPGTLEDIERRYIIKVLTEAGWRVKGSDSASARLGLKPSTLRFRMKKLGIVRPAV